MGKNLKIISLNVRGLHNDANRLKTFTWLTDQKADVVCLQETFCTQDSVKLFNSQWEGDAYHSITDSSHSRGVAILVNKATDIECVNYHKSNDGRIVLLNCKTRSDSEIYTIISAYAPNGIQARKEFLSKLEKWISQYTLNENNVILCGDLNCCYLEQDRVPSNQTQDSSKKQLNQLLTTSNMEDAWVKSQQVGNRYTFFDKKNKCKSRLDYVLLTKQLNMKLVCFKTVKPIKGDHMALAIDLKPLDCKRGPGYWKLNNQLLNDTEYINNIQKVVVDTVNEFKSVNSYRLLWEIVKIKIKEFSIKYAVCRKKNEILEEQKVQNQLDDICHKIDKTECDEQLLYLYKQKVELESKLNHMYSEKAKGIQVRSRAKWIQEGERSTKYFMRLESQRQSLNVINEVQKSNGNITTNSEEILEEISSFYSELYCSKQNSNHNVSEFIMNVETPTLSHVSKEMCDVNITMGELSEVVNNMKENRSPGLDGLTSEFYKTCWPFIDNIVYNMIIETFDKGELCDSMKKAVVTLIYKKGNKNKLCNYRPISLTNCDYKLIAFILAKRLQKVIKEIVNEDQSGYIKGRYIGHNVRLMSDILDYTESHNLSGCLLSLDFAKAYDSLEWNFMVEALKKFNFGDNFIKWVKVLYLKPVMIFKNNGWLTSPIYPSRGIRQGCPVSCLLFIISTEIMACAIRQNKDIKGISIGEFEYKLSQYADDSNLFLRDVNSIESAISLISRFTNVSGLNLNLNKTIGMWLGNYKDHPPDYDKIKFTDQPIKCLGVYIGHNVELCKEYNWKPKIEKLKKVLNSWKERELSIFGKSLVVKTLGISSLIYNFMLLDVDDSHIKTINRILYDFMWYNKERIQRNTLIGDIHKGGIAMIDVESKVRSIKASWIKHLIETTKWSGVLKTQLYELGLSIGYMLKCNFTSTKTFPIISKLSSFYQQVFINFNICKYKPGMIMDCSILSEVLWGNELFMYKGKCIYEKNWIDNGIMYVKDLIIDGNFINENEIFSVLKCKTNWIAEYVKVKKAVLKRLGGIDLTKAMYINVKEMQYVFFMKDKFISVKECTSRAFYEMFVCKKFQPPKMEYMWSKEFGLSRYSETWTDVYTTKIIEMPVHKLKEFNYKLLNSTLICGKTVSLWNKSVSRLCLKCNELHSIKHMLYDCAIVNEIWKRISVIINCDLKWKHIVVGIRGTGTRCHAYNMVITIIAYTFYSLWVRELNKERINCVNLYQCCRNSLLFYTNTLFYTRFNRVAGFIRNNILVHM